MLSLAWKKGNKQTNKQTELEMTDNSQNRILPTGSGGRTLRQAKALHAHTLVSTFSCSNSSRQLTKAWIHRRALGRS